MIDFSDNRKWSERRIAKYTLLSSLVIFILNLGVSMFFSYKANNLVNDANKLNRSTLCINLVQPKLDQLKENLVELPRLMSGCALRPKDYCREARRLLTKSKDIGSFVLSSTMDNKNQFEKILQAIASSEEIFKKDLSVRKKDLISLAGSFNSIRRNLQQIDLNDVSCID